MTSASDIRCDSVGDLPDVGAHLTGAELVAQRIGIRLRTWLGEWTLDKSKGMDWRAWQQSKPFPLQLVATMARREIDTTPGVLRSSLRTATFDADAGDAALAYDVVCDDGTALAVSLSPSVVGNRATGVLVRPGALAPFPR